MRSDICASGVGIAGYRQCRSYFAQSCMPTTHDHAMPVALPAAVLTVHLGDSVTT